MTVEGLASAGRWAFLRYGPPQGKFLYWLRLVGAPIGLIIVWVSGVSVPVQLALSVILADMLLVNLPWLRTQVRRLMLKPPRRRAPRALTSGDTTITLTRPGLLVSSPTGRVSIEWSGVEMHSAKKWTFFGSRPCRAIPVSRAAFESSQQYESFIATARSLQRAATAGGGGRQPGTTAVSAARFAVTYPSGARLRQAERDWAPSIALSWLFGAALLGSFAYFRWPDRDWVLLIVLAVLVVCIFGMRQLRALADIVVTRFGREREVVQRTVWLDDRVLSWSEGPVHAENSWRLFQDVRQQGRYWAFVGYFGDVVLVPLRAIGDEAAQRNFITFARERIADAKLSLAAA
jgi:hypothetical protein